MTYHFKTPKVALGALNLWKCFWRSTAKEISEVRTQCLPVWYWYYDCLSRTLSSRRFPQVLCDYLISAAHFGMWGACGQCGFSTHAQIAMFLHKRQDEELLLNALSDTWSNEGITVRHVRFLNSTYKTIAFCLGFLVVNKC